jgi:GNAT superfamily N-acetyltransferase
VALQLDPALMPLTLAQNEQQFYAQFASVPGTEVSTDPSVYWMIGGDELGLWNGVYRTRLDPPDADRAITDVLARFRVRGARGMTWSVLPGDRPADLGMRLGAFHGLEHARREEMLAVALDSLTAPDRAPEGLHIQPTSSDAAVQEWVHLAGFGHVPHQRDRARAANLDRYRHVAAKRGLQLYVGRIHGQPVGVCALFTGAGIASVHDVVTQPRWAHRGIGTAMTLFALLAGRAQGLRIGALTSERTGPSLYARLGFRSFGTLHRYQWTHAPQH